MSTRSGWFASSAVWAIALALVNPAHGQEEELAELAEHFAELGPRLVAATVGIDVRGSSANGSGVLIEEEGLILSAAHVLYRTGEKLTVHLADGRTAEAIALGMDHNMDIGLARMVDPGPWPYAELGYVDELEVGDWCLATGHCWGIDPERTPPLRIGKILYRSLDLNAQMGYGLRSSCTMISGDSGGPLFDFDGSVIGIHSTIGMGVFENNHATLLQAEEIWEDLLADVEVGESVLDQLAVRERSSLLGGSGSGIAGQIDGLREVQQEALDLAEIEQLLDPTPLFAVTADRAAAATVAIVAPDAKQEPVSLGAICRADGTIVTKASSLPDEPHCRLPDGRVLPAEVVHRDEDCDVAVLKIEARELPTVTWTADPAAVGTMVASPNGDGDLNGVGVVSVAERTIPAEMSSGHVQTLPMSRLGGEISDRRTGFSTAFTHDSILWARDCGGVVLNSEGEAIGLNIARFGRTGCYAIPAAEILRIVEEAVGSEHR